jgi:hypothetical protein
MQLEVPLFVLGVDFKVFDTKLWILKARVIIEIVVIIKLVTLFK